MIPLIFIFLCLLKLVSSHASIWHPSMWGFNVTDKTFPYDNRPVAPLADFTFDQWWFHGHLDHPPHKEDLLALPAGQTVTTEIACNKGATSFFATSEGGDIRQGDNPCPGSPLSTIHTTGPDDVKGCALAITYKDDVNQVQPEDFTVFSVNQTCLFHRFTNFQVPAAMPPCPSGGCICAWFWIHSPDSGSEQNYMNGFQCNITGSTSDVSLAKPQVPRRCGADPANNKPAAPGNCTYGAKQPFFWFQKERNNMFEGAFSPPFYLDLYNFRDGAQDDIFENSYPNGLPAPSPNSTVIPTPVPFGAAASVSIVAGPSSPVAVGSTTLPIPIPFSISTSTILTTQVITVTTSAFSSLPTTLATTAPPSPSTTTEFSVQLVTVTAPPPSFTPSPSSVLLGSLLPSLTPKGPTTSAPGPSTTPSKLFLASVNSSRPETLPPADAATLTSSSVLQRLNPNQSLHTSESAFASASAPIW